MPHHSGPDVRPASNAPHPPKGALILGYWAAIATSVTYITFDVGFLLDPIMSAPWDVWVPIGASALIAPAIVLLTVSIHYAAPADARVWTHSAMLVATIYATLAELVYFTWLFVVEPRMMNGNQAEVELLVFKPGSFIQMVDAAAYTSNELVFGIPAAFLVPAYALSVALWFHRSPLLEKSSAQHSTHEPTS